MVGARNVKVWISLLLLVLFCTASAGFAQSNTPKGISISPTLQEITINGDEQFKPVELTVGNNTDAAQTFVISATDFGTLGDGGGVAFEGQKDLVLKDQHRLAAWIDIPQKEVLVPANASAKVQFAIRNDERLVPGGHYGAIILRPVAAAGQNGRPRVEVSQAASSLLFVRKVGGETEGLTASGLQTQAHWWKLPESSILTFQNTGNVHVTPRGTVALVAPNGVVIAEGILNSQSSLILPDAKRTITTPLEKRSRAWMPGFYTLSVQYRPQNSETTATMSVKYFYIGTIAVLGIIIVLLVIIAGFFGWKYLAKKRS